MSGTASTDELYSGTAAALVNSGINAVAAMQFTISDAAAVAFSQGFYSALAYGRRIDEAVVSGRIAILGLGRDTLEWVTPVLCLRGDDTRLFILPPSAEERRRRRGGRTSPAAPIVPPEPGPTPGPRRVGLIAAVAAGAALLLGIGGTVAVLAALNSGGGGGGGTGAADVGGSVTLPAQIEVAGDTVWTPTGLDCTGGQRLLLTATGEVEVDDLGGIALTPEGSQQQYSTINPQPYASYASLIGRVGDGGMPFVVGTRLAMECPGDGDLQLGFNDPDPAQNLGAFSVQVSDVTVDPTITLDALTPITVDVPAECRRVGAHRHHLRPGRGLLDLGGRRDHVGGGSGAHGRGRRRHGGVRASRATTRPTNLPGLEDAQHGSLVGRHRRPAALRGTRHRRRTSTATPAAAGSARSCWA